MFLAGFFQADEGIPASSAVFQSGTAADLSFNDVFPNVAFAQVVVERDIGPFQYQQKRPGFTLVEVLSPCPTNWRMDPVSSCKWIDEIMVKEFPLGVIKEAKC